MPFEKGEKTNRGVILSCHFSPVHHAYAVEIKGKPKQSLYYHTTISKNTSKPRGSVDYASDEYTADYLGKNGEVLRTVKSDKLGVAHDIVSAYFRE